MFNIKDLIIGIFDNTGKFGPFILAGITISLLWNKASFLNYYVYGFFLNSILNLFIKGLIKEPRPNEDPKLFNLALKHGDRFTFTNGFPHDIFGMPSGHSESALYTTIYTFLVLKDYKILIGYLILSLITMIQRVVYKMHTISQVLVGAFVGIAFAYFIFYMSEKSIMGKVKEKQDDNGPV